MPKTERSLWTSLKQNLPKKTHFERIENRSGEGMPDVYLCMDGVPVWVELKIIKNGKVNPSKSQIAWHSSHSRCNGVSFFLVHDPVTGGVYLFDGASAIDLLGSKMCDLRPAIRWSGDLRSAPAALRDLSKELWFGVH